MSYAHDRAWSDQFIPTIKSIVGPLLLVESPREIDIKQAADLVILSARDMTIAARVRRVGFADRYPYQFTLRSARTNGLSTELRKIQEGWGDWLFYGHAGHSPPDIERWMVVDLHALRFHFINRDRSWWRSAQGERQNTDNETAFRWFDIRFFPPDPSLLVADSSDADRQGQLFQTPAFRHRQLELMA